MPRERFVASGNEWIVENGIPYLMAVATTATTHFTVLQQPQVLFAPKSRSSPDACSIYTRTFSFPSGKSRSNHHFQYHTKSKYGVLNCICCSTDSNSRRGLGPSNGNTNKVFRFYQFHWYDTYLRFHPFNFVILIWIHCWIVIHNFDLFLYCSCYFNSG